MICAHAAQFSLNFNDTLAARCVYSLVETNDASESGGFLDLAVRVPPNIRVAPPRTKCAPIQLARCSADHEPLRHAGMSRTKHSNGNWLNHIVTAILRTIVGAGPSRLAPSARLGAGSRGTRGRVLSLIGLSRRAPFTGRRPLGPERIRPQLTGRIGALAETVEGLLNAEQPIGYIVAAEIGARVVRFGVEPGRIERWDRRRQEAVVEQVSVRRLVARLADLGRMLRVRQLRVVPPAPGQPFVALELPHDEPRPVQLEALLATEAHAAFAQLAALPATLGEDLGGRPFLVDLATLPHLLVTGGSIRERASVLEAVVASILATCAPEEVRVLVLDANPWLSWIQAVPHVLGGGGSTPGIVETIRRLEQVVAQRLDAVAMPESRRRKRRAAESLVVEQPIGSRPAIVVVIGDLARLLDGREGTSRSSDAGRASDGAALGAALERVLSLGPSAGVHVIAGLPIDGRSVRGQTSAGSTLLRSSLWTPLVLAADSEHPIAEGAARIATGAGRSALWSGLGAEYLLGDGDFLYRDADGTLRRGQAARASVQTIEEIQWEWGPLPPQDPLRQWFSAPPASLDPARAELERQARAIAAEIQGLTPRILERRLRVGSALARALWQQLQMEGRL